MNDVNPIIIFLMFVGRCLVPLLLMLGVTYILHRLGLVKDPEPPPTTWTGNGGNQVSTRGEITHGPS